MKKLIFLITLLGITQINKAQTNNYNNYDFIPGEVTLFEDNFADATTGEFPPRWNLLNGQGTVIAEGSEKVYITTIGSVGSPHRISPAMKKKSYLGSAFTVEFDFFLTEDGNELIVHFADNNGDDSRGIQITSVGRVGTVYIEPDLFAYAPGYSEDNLLSGQWHHIALAYKDRQIKVYVDQHRALVIPRVDFDPSATLLGLVENVKIKNYRLAEGGGMNMLNKILTDGKFVSHSIRFDVNKATIKGESMGFLKELAAWLKSNPTVKLEIGGHTDSDGDDASNLKLSNDRAAAVRSKLIELGIDGNRLTSKGYGEGSPMAKNDTPEGKAENRRVEFKKL